MRAVVQRVDGASVDVDGVVVAEIVGAGLLALVGVTHTDTPEHAIRLARKINGLRVFDSATGPEQSVADLGLPVLVVSQFTLYGATDKGRRPTWDAAAPGSLAEPLIDSLVVELRNLGTQVQTGRFGAHMAVRSTNDGPLTLMIDLP